MFATVFYFLLAASMVLLPLGGLLLMFSVSGAIAGALGWAVRKAAPSLLPLSWKQARENKHWTTVVVLCGVIVQILILTVLVAPSADLSKLLSVHGLCSTLLSFVLWAIYGIASIRADSQPTLAPVEVEFAGTYRSAGVQAQSVAPSKPMVSTGVQDIDRACSLLGVFAVILSTQHVTFCATLVLSCRIHLVSFVNEPGLRASVLMFAASWVLLRLRASIRLASDGGLGGWRTMRDIVACAVLVLGIVLATSNAIGSGERWTVAVAAGLAVFGVALAVVAVGFVRFVRNGSRTPRVESQAQER